MLPNARATKVRIHLPSGTVYEAEAEDVTVTQMGTIWHKKGEGVQRRFLGVALEFFDQEQLIQEVPARPSGLVT